MSRGRVTTYLLRYQLADALLLRAALPAVMVVLFGTMLLKTGPHVADWTGPRERVFLRQMFDMLAGMFITVGPFIGVARLVTDDRANGYFRFLFSKPVSIERFYVQQWLLIGGVFVVLTGAVGVWLQALTAEVPVGAAMAVMALTWVLVGGVGFALTAATNYDAAVLVLAYLLSAVLHAVKDSANSPMWPWLRQVTRLTLPTQKLDFVRAELYAGNPLPWGHAAHVIAYGAIALALGVLILRRSSFAR